MVTKKANSLLSKCILCGITKQAIEPYTVFDTRFGIKEEYEIGRCGTCGTEQLRSPPFAKQLKELYETYYNFEGEKGTTYIRYREYFFSSFLYTFWLIIDGDVSFHLERGSGPLLDIGCNEGRGLTIYQKHGFAAEGLEFNEQAAAEAKSRGLSVYTEPLEVFHPQEPYDVVVLANVLEHSLDPENMLSRAHRILKPGGQLWISCPNSQSWLRGVFGKYWINWHVPFHITFFSATTLKLLLNDTGFVVLKSRCVSPALWFAQSVIAKLFTVKGKKTYAQRSSMLLGSLMLFARLVLFPALWLGNLLGRGDCLVLEAEKRE